MELDCQSRKCGRDTRQVRHYFMNKSVLRIVDELINKYKYYTVVHDRHWPLREIDLPDRAIMRLSLEDRKLLEQATPKDFNHRIK